jgi:hypothetical protein
MRVLVSRAYVAGQPTTDLDINDGIAWTVMPGTGPGEDGIRLVTAESDFMDGVALIAWTRSMTTGPLTIRVHGDSPQQVKARIRNLSACFRQPMYTVTWHDTDDADAYGPEVWVCLPSSSAVNGNGQWDPADLNAGFQDVVVQVNKQPV